MHLNMAEPLSHRWYLKYRPTHQHAGVAITVTSAANVLAFAVGAVTVFPGLRVKRQRDRVEWGAIIA